MLVERAIRLHPDLLDGTPTVVVAAGKAAPAMAAAAARALGAAVRGGVVIAPATSSSVDGLEQIVAEHPEPGAGSERAGRRALEICGSIRPGARLLVLLSGGASSLMAAPASGLTLEDKQRTTRTLLRAGADITQLNTVRKHLSAVKGGWLAARSPAAIRTFAISDVVGNDLSSIASGPTVPDATSFTDAWRVLQMFGGPAAFPERVVARLELGMRDRTLETPKPDDPRLARSTADVIGSRFDAMAGARQAAEVRGYDVVVLEEPVVGEARSAGPALWRKALSAAQSRRRPLCVVASGETTVTVNGHGRGGRNQELVLATAPLIAPGSVGAIASLGTDGVDGPTDAAGALVDSSTLRRARSAGLGPPEDYLRENNSYAFFAPLDDLLRTGPTGTNVGDLQIILLA